VRAGYARCPEPRGPRSTREEMLRETHHRSERGTRCWLEKRCTKSSAYMYDRDIAAAIRARFEATPKFRDASLWVTVQGRYAWIEGCVRSARERRSLEALARAVPDVDLMTVNVAARPDGKPPYYTLY
jgi:BON domain-containing protein